jgi:hypothetical protein
MNIAFRKNDATDRAATSVEVSTTNPLPVALGADTDVIGKVGIDQTTPGTTNGVVVNSSALPSGAATSAKQDTLIGHVDGIEALLAAATPAGENHIGEVGSAVANPTDNFTRPNDTTAYASGDLVANSTTAGSVTPLTLTVARVAAGSFMLRRLKLHKSGTSTTNASFRVHLYTSAPTCANGDNGAFSTSGVATYIGAFDVTIDRAFTDGAAGFGVPVVGGEHAVKLASGTTIKALIEARAAYTPAAQEVFTVTVDDWQN